MIRISALLLILATSPTALAQEGGGPQNVGSVNLLSNILGAYSIEYERVLTPSVSLFVEPVAFNINPREGFFLGLTGFGLNVGARWFLFEGAPAGLFVAPELQASYTDSLGDAASAQPGLAAGAVVGWTFILFQSLVLSPGLGARVNLVGYSLYGSLGPSVTPLLRANLGVAF